VAGLTLLPISVAVLAYCAVTWRHDDPLYDRPPKSAFYGDDGWHAMRRSLLPSGTALLFTGLLVVLGAWWRSAPTWVFAVVVIAAVGGIGIFMSVFLFNRPRLLVRPSLRDQPGWLRVKRDRRAAVKPPAQPTR
jgi:hypothetical protein